MFVRLDSDDVSLIHVKGWIKWFNDFLMKIALTLSLMVTDL